MTTPPLEQLGVSSHTSCLSSQISTQQQLRPPKRQKAPRTLPLPASRQHCGRASKGRADIRRAHTDGLTLHHTCHHRSCLRACSSPPGSCKLQATDDLASKISKPFPQSAPSQALPGAEFSETQIFSATCLSLVCSLRALAALAGGAAWSHWAIAGNGSE